MSIIPSFRRNSIFDLDLWEESPSIATMFELSRGNSASLNPKIDWKETPEAHVFMADVPGLKKEEVKIEIEDDKVLQICGESKIEKEDKNDKWHLVERSNGKFFKRFRLPENAKVDEIKAAMENGVLSMTIPKVGVKKPVVKVIEVLGNP